MSRAEAKQSLQKEIEAQNEASVKERNETSKKSGLGAGFGLDINQELYMDISDFMADNTFVECVVEDFSPFGGFADKICRASGQLHLQKRSRVFIPFAAAAILHRKGFAKLCLPSMFNEAMRQSIQLDPLMIDVKSIHPYYFEFGMKIAKLLDDVKLRDLLLQAAETRIITLLQLANDEIDRELEAITLTGGLVQHKNYNLHRTVDRSGRPIDPMKAGRKLFLPTNDERQLPPNLKLFLQSLSNSESEIFRRHKECLMKTLRFQMSAVDHASLH